MERILTGEIIEHCPLMILGPKDSEFVDSKDNSDVIYYYFLQQPDLKRNAIMLGFGSIYNHSSDPNCEIDYPDEDMTPYIIFRAIKDIEVGEEITWNYEFDNDVIEFLPERTNHEGEYPGDNQ